MTYEELMKSDDVSISEIDMSAVPSLKGLYYAGSIGIDKNLKTTKEKACVLAEELGHHYTSVGNIIDMDSSSNRKQERQARLWAYNKQIGLKGLVRAYEHGCTASHEIAEYLDATEEALQECIEFYRDKYGEYKTFEHYIIFFIPHLAVLKKI